MDVKYRKRNKDNYYLQKWTIQEGQFQYPDYKKKKSDKNKISTEVTEVTSTPTRPVDNVVTTKGLQDRNNNCLMEGRWKIEVNYF